MRALWLLPALCACVPDNSPLMRPGEDCLSCHGGVGGTERAQPWSAAGTVFASAAVTSGGFEGAQVRITDATGFSFSLRTNLAGNFYTAESLQFPLQACIVVNGKTVCQQSPIAKSNSGASCNVCHQPAELGGTQPQLTPP